MNKTRKPFLTLLFNVFLTKTARYQGVEFQNELDKYLSPIRESKTNYKKRSKIEICGYALASISEIKWDHAIINIEISNDYTDEEKTWLMDYAKSLLPKALISSNRAKTRDEYLAIFDEIKSINPESYVCFLPNHDHIFMGHDSKLITQYLDILKEEETKTHHPVRLCFSNQLENILATREDSPIYNLFLLGGNILKENEQYILVERENYAWDSYYISRISVIDDYFKSSQNTGYCPRGEDCFPYPFPEIRNLSLIPKTKLFEHYDGSHHVFGFKSFKSYQNKFSNRVPPLFIPPGFFEGKIKIKLGRSQYDPEFINASKSSEYAYLAKTSDGIDINLSLFKIPFFWKSRILEVYNSEQNDSMELMKNIPTIELENPFFDFPTKLIKKRNEIFNGLATPDEFQQFYEKNIYSISIFERLKLLFKKF